MLMKLAVAGAYVGTVMIAFMTAHADARMAALTDAMRMNTANLVNVKKMTGAKIHLRNVKMVPTLLVHANAMDANPAAMQTVHANALMIANSAATKTAHANQSPI